MVNKTLLRNINHNPNSSSPHHVSFQFQILCTMHKALELNQKPISHQQIKIQQKHIQFPIRQINTTPAKCVVKTKSKTKSKPTNGTKQTKPIHAIKFSTKTYRFIIPIHHKSRHFSQNMSIRLCRKASQKPWIKNNYTTKKAGNVNNRN